MPEYVLIKFTGGISVYPDTLLSILEKDIYNDYDPADSRCGYEVIPASPKIAREIRVWAPDIELLYTSCQRAIRYLEQKLNRQIPVEIKIEGGDE